MDSRLCESLLSFSFYFFVYKQNNAENSKNVIIIIGGDKRRPHNLDQTNLCKPGGLGGRGTWVNDFWVCDTGLSEPLPHYSLFFGQ